METKEQTKIEMWPVAIPEEYASEYVSPFEESDKQSTKIISLIDKDEFRSWLEEHKGEVVGTASGNFDCPIHNYIQELWGQSVDVSPISCSGWSKAFIETLDAQWGLDEVTGGNSLDALDRAERNVELTEQYRRLTNL